MGHETISSNKFKDFFKGVQNDFANTHTCYGIIARVLVIPIAISLAFATDKCSKTNGDFTQRTEQAVRELPSDWKDAYHRIEDFVKHP
ncbi:MAG: hypothetical protein Q7R51_01630 [bacterium]|nr:hypothetical protein [bacterium]